MEDHLDGLPQYSVTLSGNATNPVIENRSGRAVIAYVLNLADQNGRGPVHQMLLAFSGPPEGIPDGGSIHVRWNRVKSSGEGPIVKATLQNLIFADGQFVGIDEQGAFESFCQRIKVIVEVGLLAKTGAWDQLDALDQAFRQIPRPEPPSEEDYTLYTFRQIAAQRLVETRKFKGDAAAAELAELYSSQPTLWK